MGVADEIKARLDIVDVVADHVPDLKRSGKNYHARCPFHQERTPSFVVFPDRQTWRCFGACATGGDLFSFVMKAEGVDFSAALRSLAARAGVHIEQRRAAERVENPLYSVNDAAQQLFRDAFVADRGAQARAYADARRLTDESIARFGVGYAPAAGEEILSRLAALGFDPALVHRAGLAIGGDGETGPARAMFRGRLMFPLRDADGRIAGFAGRTLDGSDPKYINTPQTPVFDKGRMLYGFDRAKEAISAEKTAVVVEGYMDVIAAHEHGVRNVVATMGTALTPPQIDLLRARAERIILALDADAAGQEAVRRSLDSIAVLAGSPVPGARGTELRNRPADLSALFIAAYSAGKDPDELIRTDVGEFRRLLNEAIPVVEFLYRVEPPRHDLATTAGKTALVERLLPITYALGWVDQERYFRQLAELVGVSVEQLQARAKQMGAQPAGARRPAPRPRPSADPQHPVDPVIAAAERDPLEEQVLALLAQHPEEFWEKATLVDAGHFRHWENRETLSAVQVCATMQDALAQLDGQLADRLVRLSQGAFPPADKQQRAAAWEECLRRLEERRLRELKAQEGAAFARDAAGDAPADPEYLEAVGRSALDINRRLQDLFVRGPG